MKYVLCTNDDGKEEYKLVHSDEDQEVKRVNIELHPDRVVHTVTTYNELAGRLNDAGVKCNAINDKEIITDGTHLYEFDADDPKTEKIFDEFADQFNTGNYVDAVTMNHKCHSVDWYRDISVPQWAYKKIIKSELSGECIRVFLFLIRELYDDDYSCLDLNRADLDGMALILKIDKSRIESAIKELKNAGLISEVIFVDCMGDDNKGGSK